MLKEVVKFKSDGVEWELCRLSLTSEPDEVETWKHRVQSSLEEKELWAAVETDLRHSSLFWKNKKAINLITQCVSDDVIPMIRSEKSAKAMWAMIESHNFGADGSQGRVNNSINIETSTVRNARSLGLPKSQSNCTNKARFSGNYDNFLAAQTVPEKTEEIKKLNTLLKTSNTAADNIGQNKEVIVKCTNILKNETDKNLLDAVNEFYINLTNLVKTPAAKFICEIVGQTLIDLARQGKADIAASCCWILGNLTKFAESVICLKPKGLVQLYFQLTKDPKSSIAHKGISGLEICLEHLPNLLMDKDFQDGAILCCVAAKCVQIVKAGHAHLSEAVESALTVLAEITSQVSAYLLSGLKDLIQECLDWFFGLFKDNSKSSQKDVIRSLNRCIVIMRYAGDECVKDYLKQNHDSLDVEELKEYYERNKENYERNGDGADGEGLFSWFKNVVLNTLMAIKMGFLSALEFALEFVEEHPTISAFVACGAVLLGGAGYLAIKKFTK